MKCFLIEISCFINETRQFYEEAKRRPSDSDALSSQWAKCILVQRYEAEAKDEPWWAHWLADEANLLIREDVFKNIKIQRNKILNLNYKMRNIHYHLLFVYSRIIFHKRDIVMYA